MVVCAKCQAKVKDTITFCPRCRNQLPARKTDIFLIGAMQQMISNARSRMNVFTTCCIFSVVLVGAILISQQILRNEWINSPLVWLIITLVAILGIVCFEIANHYAGKLANLKKQLEKEQT